MSIPAGVTTVLVSAIPQTTSPVVPGTVSVQVTPSANLIWQTTGQSLATMCTMSPAPGWVVLPAVDQAGFITPDTRQGVTDWSYLITASWQQADGTRHTENGTIQCFSNQQVEYLSGTTGQLTPAATYPVGGIALNGWVATYSALPAGLTAANAGAAYMVQSDGRLYIWSGTAWPASGQGFAATGPAGPTGSVGPAGPANTLSVGSVATGAPLSITITGTAPNQTINFVLPEGHWWSGTGAPGTISGALNGDFYIDNSGTGAIYQLQSGTWVSQGSLLGPTGARGSNWYTGTGAPGTITGQASGDFYLDTATGNVYRYNGTSWVLQGSILGPTGATGTRGSDWFTGTGAPGTVTGAISGDFYLDTGGTGNFYKYNGTSWALQGSLIGPTGAAGASSTWRVGSGVPASGLGVNGDMYLNTATGDIYGPKASGSWGAVVENIVGPSAAGATSSAAGIVQLAGDLSGTYTAPTVPGKESFLVPTAAKTANYTAAVLDLAVMNAASGALTVTLPTAPANNSRVGVVKNDSSTNTVTVQRGGTDIFLYGSATSRTLVMPGQAEVYQYVSGVWYMVATGLLSSQLDARYAPLASPTLTGTITLNGTVAGSGTATAATAGTVALRDSNGNLTSANMLDGYTTTATAAGTSTLTVSSNGLQFFTGTTTQTVVLPVASTLALGQSWIVVNNSTGTVTVQSSGANTVVAIPGGSQSTVTCILTSGTTASSWSATPPYAPLASPAFTGTPTVPTPSTADSSTRAASTAYVQANLASYAPLASPALTGTPTVPTASSGTNTTQAASTAFVQTQSLAAGGVSSLTAETANFSAASAGGIYAVSASSGAVTATLPAAPANGTTVGLVKTDNTMNALTVTAGGSDVIGASGTTSVKLFGLYNAGAYRYFSGTWYPQEAGAPCDYSYAVQSGTRATGYGDLPEGAFIGRNGAVVWVRWRAGTADASGSNTIALYSNTSNSATGTAVSGGSTSLTATSAGAVSSWVGPFTVAGGTYLQTNVTAVGTTPGSRLYMDLFGQYL